MKRKAVTYRLIEILDIPARYQVRVAIWHKERERGAGIDGDGCHDGCIC